MTNKKHFVPLECNPEVFTSLAHSLGVSKALAFHDVYAIDEPDLLAMVPRPVQALIMAFPVTERYEEYRLANDKHLEDDYYTKISGTEQEDALWFKQTIGNACGTYGLLHALANGLPSEFIEPGSTIDQIIKDAKPLGVEERAKSLEQNPNLESKHGAVASSGDTEAPEATAYVEHHYVCLTRSAKSGDLFELDGRRKGPINRGKLEPELDLLSELPLKVVQEFLTREGESGQFSLIALAPSID